MKSMLKIFLVISLFSSIALADGDMGTGGFTDGDMGTGGKTCTQNCPTVNQTVKNSKDQEINSVLEYVQDFLARILG
ncbi:hypothetical protein BH10ACI1_BH10ACI1_26830 [soil metagenome]